MGERDDGKTRKWPMGISCAEKQKSSEGKGHFDLWHLTSQTAHPNHSQLGKHRQLPSTRGSNPPRFEDVHCLSAGRGGEEEKQSSQGLFVHTLHEIPVPPPLAHFAPGPDMTNTNILSALLPSSSALPAKMGQSRNGADKSCSLRDLALHPSQGPQRGIRRHWAHFIRAPMDPFCLTF